MKLLRSLAALLCLMPAVAWAESGAKPPPGLAKNGAADAATVLGRTMQSREQDVISVLDSYGATVYRDTRQAQSSTSITAGSSALTCAGCAFTAADVGKLIVIPGAGATATTGAVNAPAVTAPGSYTVQPSIAVSGGGGQSAALRPLMGAVTATLQSGGSGYTNGTQTLTARADGCNTPVQVSVTVSGGVVTSVNSITNAGSCWNINATGFSAVPTTGPAGFGATLNFTWGVVAADVQGGGWNYSLTANAVTASVTGGTFTSAATLGSVTVTPPIAPLATSIQNVIDSTHATLATPALTSVSGSRLITFGHDDGPAISGAIAFACASSARAAVLMPGDGWGLATTIDLPNNCGLDLSGSGRGITSIRALATPAIPASYAAVNAASLPSMIFKGQFTGSEVTIRDLSIDALHLVAAPVFWHGGRGELANIKISNPAPQVVGGAGLIVGDPVTYYYTNSLHVTNITVQDRLGATTADLPQSAIAVYTPDNTFSDGIYAINAAVQNIYDSSGNAWTKPHPFNFPTNILSQYSMTTVGGRVDQPYLDSPIVAGINQIFSSAGILNAIAPYCFWSGGPGPASVCVQVASGQRATVTNTAIGNVGFPAANAVVLNGTPSQQTIVTPALGATGQPFATGGFVGSNNGWSLTTPDNGISGGNARGSYSFDGQAGVGCRTAASQVAAGAASAALGCGNTVTSSVYGGFSMGNFNTVDASNAVSLGARANSYGRSGSHNFSGGLIGGGVSQSAQVVMGARAITTSATRLWVGGSAGFQNSATIAQGRTARYDVTAKCQNTTSLTDYGTWHFPTVMFSRKTGDTFGTMTPSSVTAILDAGTAQMAAGQMTLTNDVTTYPGPNISFTPPYAANWDCTAVVNIVD